MKRYWQGVRTNRIPRWFKKEIGQAIFGHSMVSTLPDPWGWGLRHPGPKLAELNRRGREWHITLDLPRTYLVFSAKQGVEGHDVARCRMVTAVGTRAPLCTRRKIPAVRSEKIGQRILLDEIEVCSHIRQVSYLLMQP